jgi:hypothetical protein
MLKLPQTRLILLWSHSVVNLQLFSTFNSHFSTGQDSSTTLSHSMQPLPMHLTKTICYKKKENSAAELKFSYTNNTNAYKKGDNLLWSKNNSFFKQHTWGSSAGTGP